MSPASVEIASSQFAMAAGPGRPMSHITGVACYDHYVWSYTPVALGQYFNSGYMVTFCTQGSPPLSNVIGNHCYALLAWDAATDQFTLGNPWGFDYVDNHGVLVGEVTLSEAQLVSCVDDYAISSVAVNFIPVPVGFPMASASVSLVTKTANPNSLLPNLIPSRTEHTIPFGVDFKLVKGSAGDSGSFRDNGAVGSSPILDKVMTDWNRTQPTELDVHELSTHETWQLTSRMTSELAEEGLLPIDNRTWDGFSWDRVLTQKASEGEFLPNFR